MREKMTTERMKQLIAEMTIEEKAGMLHADGPFQTKGVERLGIPPLVMDDGPMGVRSQLKLHKWEPFSCNYDFVSYLPSNMAVASTWNPELAHRFGTTLGREARGRGKDVILAPGINIIRTPLCGRNFEYMSEDPYLVAQMVVPLIKGIQEQDAAACVKHFALNSQEHDRFNINAEVDDRTLHEIYLPGFKAAVKQAGSYTIMSAYNKYRGVYCSHSTTLLKKILKGDWQFDGVVISDWGAVHDTKAAVENGLDIEMHTDDNYDDYFYATKLIEAVKNGTVSESLLDEKILRILKLMSKLKIFDGDRLPGAYNSPENRENALAIARESIVLLKNEGNLLPFNKKKKLTVIGDNADRQHANGGGSAMIKALYEHTPLMGLKMLLGGDAEITWCKGYSADAGEKENEALAEEAVQAARDAEQLVFIGGLNHDYDCEGHDRKDMRLPYGQDELIRRILNINQNAVIVLFGGSPVDMHEWVEQAPALAQMWYAGMEGGYALAEVLFGDVNPSGKLSLSMPKTYEDCAVSRLGEYPGTDSVHYTEGLKVGYRFHDACKVDPLFCFGHGLSYTTFRYDDIVVESVSAGDPAFCVTAHVTNTGSRAGAEAVQLYVAAKSGDAERPVKELKGLTKVYMEPGKTHKIELGLDKTSFAWYDAEQSCWRCDAGTYEILLGASSHDLRLKAEITIEHSLTFAD